MEIKSILFVCLEIFAVHHLLRELQKLYKKKNLDLIIESAGTDIGMWVKTQEILSKLKLNGVDISNQKAKTSPKEDFKTLI